MILSSVFGSNVMMTTYTANDRAGWLKLRRKTAGMDDLTKRVRLGGSDVATIMGLSEFKTAGSLYYTMLGLKPEREVQNIHTYRGQVLEPVIKDCYWVYHDRNDDKVETLLENAAMGRKIQAYQDVHAIIKNKRYRQLFADIDSYIPEQNGRLPGILEIKSMYRTALEKWEGGIPPQYVIQLQVYMMITEVPQGEIFVLADATIPYSFPFEANKEIQENILYETQRFCKKVNKARREIAKCSGEEDEVFDIAARYEPPAEKRPQYIEFLKEQHRPENAKEPHEGNKKLLEKVIDYSNARVEIQRLEKSIVGHEVDIRKVFVDNQTDTIIFPFTDAEGAPYPRVTWKQKFNLPYKKFATNL